MAKAVSVKKKKKEKIELANKFRRVVKMQTLESEPIIYTNNVLTMQIKSK